MKKQSETMKSKLARQFRHSLADINALPQLTIAGMLTGLFASLLIVLFRLSIELPLSLSLPEHIDNFEALPRILHFLLPVTGAIFLAICATYINKKYHMVSVGNVLERFHNFQGRMSTGNFLVQFFGGIISLITGQSVGREGPAVHIGASAASMLGQWLKLPNNSLRTLIGCGVAAAIAASFNTPIAGVIFSMEVVVMSYSVTGFIPILVASICGSLIAQLVFGNDFFFSTSGQQMHELWDIPLMIIAGLIIGIFATIYMRIQLSCYRFHSYPIQARLIVAGLITGSLALIAPEILGLGYDTVNAALEGKLTLYALLLILIAKILATGISVGLGVPGGLIGPQLFTGACLGAIIALAMQYFLPAQNHNIELYVLLGMAAMMGAVINAPLAALMAILELTYNPNIIFPSMLIIVVSCLTTRTLFKCDGIFVEQLNIMGKSLNSSPSQQHLNNIGIRNLMDTRFALCPNLINYQQANDVLALHPVWLIFYSNNEPFLIKASSLAAYINLLENAKEHTDENRIDLLEIVGKQFTISLIDERATLYEAKKMLQEKSIDALLVNDVLEKMQGVITQDTIDDYYKL